MWMHIIGNSSNARVEKLINKITIPLKSFNFEFEKHAGK